ncbi:signal peptidase I [Desulfurispirillum indicum S5]|uniref:Signal peptidase I n=1 Tax=Desulfurispirillum indicum (strain ATCC BAA-1389 / DSM 22839 / S5) TaxID=653733 RepID=E6W3R5_DESIS|nr:signal peptidase I [Desulfurispirillum indicum S5]
MVNETHTDKEGTPVSREGNPRGMRHLLERHLDLIIAVFYTLCLIFWADQLPLKMGTATVSLPMVVILTALIAHHAFYYVVRLLKTTIEKGRFQRFVDEISQVLAMALVIIIFIVQAFKIPSGSMLETLQIGDHLLVNKFIYTFVEVERGDVVVFKFPPEPHIDYIKRVVGLPGDRIRIEAKRVYVNDEPFVTGFEQFKDSQLQTGSPRDNMKEFQVPQGNYFMLGDNRDNSFDSRFWGFVPEENIVGKAFILYFSWDSENSAVRFNRIGRLIR